MEIFTFSWEPIAITAEKAVLRGNLDRSIDWDTDINFRQFRENLRSKSEGKIIVIDLTYFGTWDTEGLDETIKKVIEPLVRNGARIGICGSKKADKIHPQATGLSQVYEDAKLKQGIVDTDLLPWEETSEETLSRLKNRSKI